MLTQAANKHSKTQLEEKQFKLKLKEGATTKKERKTWFVQLKHGINLFCNIFYAPR